MLCSLSSSPVFWGRKVLCCQHQVRCLFQTCCAYVVQNNKLALLNTKKKMWWCQEKDTHSSLTKIRSDSDLCVLWDFGEQEEEVFKKQGSRRPKLLHETARLHALLSFVGVILRPEGRITEMQNWNQFVEEGCNHNVSFSHLSHCWQQRSTDTSFNCDFSILHSLFYKVITFLLLLWEEWRGLHSTEQLFSCHLPC